MTSPKTPWSAARLKALRAKQKPKLSQETLAKQAGLPRETVNKLENATRSMTLHYAMKLAPPLGVKPEDLLPPDDPAAPPDPLDRLERVEDLVDEIVKQRLEQVPALMKRVLALEREVLPKPGQRKKG